MRKMSCSLIYEGNILAKVGGFSLKNVASSNLHFILYVIKKSNNEMPFTNSYIQDGFNKKKHADRITCTFCCSCYLLRENA